MLRCRRSKTLTSQPLRCSASRTSDLSSDMEMPELLAPAGSAAALNAAVRAGADAVYLGLDRFNARQNADNFTLDALERACDYAHLRGVKVYVTMNTLILGDEMREACSTARAAYERGADALIIQDLGLAANIMRMLPPEALHISTQMNIHSADGLLAAAELGASRVTLARELSLGEISELVLVGREAGVECEVFAHGAICVCYSGQCLMSSMIGGRSANRGVCAQACRLPYHLVRSDAPDRELRAPGEFLLSPKDMCTADRLDDLASAGVASLKIEGRMKSPEYVHAVVSVYRRALDRLACADGEQGGPEGRSRVLSQEDREALGSVFSRGFTDSYLDGESADELMSYQRPNNRGQFAGRVKSVSGDEICIASEVQLVPGDLLEAWTRKGNVRFTVPHDASASKRSVRFSAEGVERIRANDRVFRIRSAEAAFKEDAHEPRVPVSAEVWLIQGEPLRMRFRVIDGFPRPLPEAAGDAVGPVVEAARTKAVTRQDVEEHIGRMGSTPFVLADTVAHLDAGVGIGFSQLHACRTQALEELERALLAPFRDRTSCTEDALAPHANAPQASAAPLIAVLATSPETARIAKRTGADLIYVPAFNYQRGGAEVAGCAREEVDQAGYPKGCIIVMPSIDRDGCGASAEALRGLDAWKNIAPGSEVMVESLGGMHRAQGLGCIIDVGAKMPLMNPSSLAVAEAFGVRRAWLSPELNAAQLRSMAKAAPMEVGVKVYGAQELMVTEHCLLSSQGPCDEDCAACKRRSVSFGLKDRKGYVFPVVTDVAGRSHLYNSVTLDIVPDLPDLMAAGVSCFLVDATLMDAEQTAQAVGRIRHAIEEAACGRGAVPKMPNTTSGHLHRGIS